MSFTSHWSNILAEGSNIGTDAIFSITEAALNNFFDKHHEYDKSLYTYKAERTFTYNGNNRKFTLLMRVEEPFNCDLLPFTDHSKERDAIWDGESGWVDLEEARELDTQLFTNSDDDSIRVLAKRVSLKLTWPDLKGGKPHEFSFQVKIAATGQASLIEVPKEQNTGSNENFYALSVRLTKIKFEQEMRLKIANALEQMAVKDIALKEAAGDQKFIDLFIILINIVAARFAPKVVANVKLPTFEIGSEAAIPRMLDVSNDILSFGAGVNREALMEDARSEIATGLSTYYQALDEDIEAAGGVGELLYSNYSVDKNIEELVPRPDKELSKMLTKSSGFITKLETSLLEKELSDAVADDREATEVKQVASGVGVGVNEYLLDVAIDSSMPPDEAQKCTKWLSAGVVRGRACYWTRFANPNIDIDGTDVKGDIDIDVGGALEACFKKFYDCSWDWKCGRLALALKGRPGIKIGLKKSSGIKFNAQLRGRLELETNLPFPFNEVVKGISRLVWEAVKVIINLVLRRINFTVVPDKIELPDQKTRLRLKNFAPFSFVRKPAVPLLPSQREFLGYSCDVLAEK
ncbi:hypothetical protein [Roseovarius phycicola]|uniref:Uncharacterized protein n=1 Tax=Roseovarius phycicola TaxID=3080976 RepID=A0ABZ2HG31_9RHOB